jgi:membrane protease subunit (stomatin/prohibitin family)
MLGQLGMQGLGMGLQGSQQLGQLGAQQQQTDLARIQAQAAAGAEQRQLQQQRLDTSYADFLRQRDYPMEQLGYFSNLLRGVPVQLGSTQTTYAQPPSLASQVAGLGLAGLGMYNLAK